MSAYWSDGDGASRQLPAVQWRGRSRRRCRCDTRLGRLPDFRIIASREVSSLRRTTPSALGWRQVAEQEGPISAAGRAEAASLIICVVLSTSARAVRLLSHPNSTCRFFSGASDRAWTISTDLAGYRLGRPRRADRGALAGGAPRFLVRPLNEVEGAFRGARGMATLSVLAGCDSADSRTAAHVEAISDGRLCLVPEDPKQTSLRDCTWWRNAREPRSGRRLR